MPELPEVETITRRLRPLVVGKKILTLKVLREKSFQGDLQKIAGTTITALTRRAKIIRFQLEHEQNLLVHLKMTGQLLYVDDQIKVGGGHPTADWVHDLPSSHTRIVFHLSDGATLYFNDMRVFGWVRVMSDDEVAAEFAALAPDIVDDQVTPEYLAHRLRRRTQPIKQVIMDNAVVCGVGNIYACDALNLAGVSPFKPARDLTPAEVDTVTEAMKTVIARGIELGGATISHFAHVDGFSGMYQDVRRVYAREGEACLTCGTAISKTKLGGRGTYFCGTCQVA